MVFEHFVASVGDSDKCFLKAHESVHDLRLKYSHFIHYLAAVIFGSIKQDVTLLSVLATLLQRYYFPAVLRILFL